MPTTRQSGTDIAWEERGTGDPVLLIMGASFSRGLWHRVVEDLSTDYRVIWFDNRGFGDSGPTTADYSVRDMASDAVAVLDDAGVPRAHVYGASLGGVVAQELALTWPGRVRSLVLGCTWATTPDRFTPGGSTALRNRIPHWLTLALARPVLYGPAGNRADAADDIALLRAQPYSRAEVRRQWETGAAHESMTRLSQLQAPTLVLHGDHDRVIPFEWGKELAQKLPNSTFVPLTGAGHMYMTDRREASTTAVRAFFNDPIFSIAGH